MDASRENLKRQILGISNFFSARGALYWSLTSLIIYFVLTPFSVIFFTALGVFVALEPVGVLAMSVFGLFFGVGGSLLTEFALAPYLLQKTLKVRAFSEDESRVFKEIKSSFQNAGFRTPRCWIINTEDSVRDEKKLYNAFIAGFRSARGIFSPALFLTDSLVKEFSSEEIQAIIAHEVSHLALNHGWKRFAYTLLAITGALSVAVVAMTVTVFILPSLFWGPVYLMGMLVPFMATGVLVKRQMRGHEFEADRHAVLDLNIESQTLSSVLEKLEQLAGADKKGFAEKKRSFFRDTHPTAQDRILALNQLPSKKPLSEAA
jgi:Zn-dependent protease with chaperone function